MTAGIFRGPSLIASGAIAVCCALAASILVFAHAATELRSARALAEANERIVRLIDPTGREALESLIEALKKEDGVASVAAIELADLAATSQESTPLDTSAPSLDPLGLVAITLAGDLQSDVNERLQASLADQGISVTISAPGSAVRDAIDKARAERTAALVLAGIVSIMLLLVARWVAQLGHSRSANPAQVMAFLGATRTQALARISGPALVSGFFSGLAGVLGVVGLALVSNTLAPELVAAFLPSGLPIDTNSLTILGSTPVVSAALMRAGARAAASQAFAIEQPTP